MEYNLFNMGEIIRGLRKEAGVTQDALAQAAGVSVQAVSKWETGQSLPDVALLPVLADYFHISVDALFGRESAPAAASEPYLPFPDDNKYRIVQYLGTRMLSAGECRHEQSLRIAFDTANVANHELHVEVQGSAQVDGELNGSLTAYGNANIAGNVNGAVNCKGEIKCIGNINGAVSCRGGVAGKNGESIGDIVGASLGRAFSGMMGGIFGNRRTGGVGAHMNAFFSGQLPEDDVLRVVQLRGRRILAAEESSGRQVIRLAVDHLEGPLNVEVYGSAEIKGNVGGNATAGDGLTCTGVGGNASAGDALTCTHVGGNASAGDSLTCTGVAGSVNAGDSVQVKGDVGGSVKAGDSVTCGNIQGDVRADSVKCAAFQGNPPPQQAQRPVSGFGADVSHVGGGDALYVVQVHGGRVLAAQEAQGAIHLCVDELDGADVVVQGDAVLHGGIEGNLHVGGNAQIDGSVEGDVHAQGDVSCTSVEGDVQAGGEAAIQGGVEGDMHAGGSATIMGGVEGDASAGGEMTIGGYVEGNVQGGAAVSVGDYVDGNVTAGNGEVHVEGHVEGNVLAGGNVTCVSIEGDVRALSVNCDTIGGDVIHC